MTIDRTKNWHLIQIERRAVHSARMCLLERLRFDRLSGLYHFKWTQIHTANDDTANIKMMIGDNNDQTIQACNFHNQYHKFSHKINPIEFYYYNIDWELFERNKHTHTHTVCNFISIYTQNYLLLNQSHIQSYTICSETNIAGSS